MVIPTDPFPPNMVTITEAEYKALLADAKWLATLERAGIDNSEAYDYACQLRREEGGEEEDEW